MNVDKFAADLAEARKEITLQDLTEDQWGRVCNRIAQCLFKQGLMEDWDGFIQRSKPS